MKDVVDFITLDDYVSKKAISKIDLIKIDVDGYEFKVITGALETLKSYNPIGEAAELIYETTEESRANHIAEVKTLDAQLTYLPITICVPLIIFGIGFLWRYGGRSYYWKRYKDFER